MARRKKSFQRVNRKTEKREAWLSVNLDKRNPSLEKVEGLIKERYIGQEEAIGSVLDGFSKITSGLGNGKPGEPFGVFLFLGPTGVGKTELVKIMASHFVGEYGAITRIDCGELSGSDAVNRFTGAQPGYIGSDLEPMLSQGNIDLPYLKIHFPGLYELQSQLKKMRSKYEREKEYLSKEELAKMKKAVLALTRRVETERERVSKARKYSIVLLDEIEKAHPKVLRILLNMLAEGCLTHNQGTTSFKDSIVVMTSNLGAKAMEDILKGKGAIGFLADSGSSENKVEASKRAVLDAWEKSDLFPPELRGRIVGCGNVVIFRHLSEQQLESIVELQVNIFANEILERKFPGKDRIVVQYDPGKGGLEEFIVSQANSAYGARGIAGALKKYVFDPLRQAVSAKQIVAGDVVHFYVNGDEVEFYRAKRKEPSKKGPSQLREVGKK